MPKPTEFVAHLLDLLAPLGGVTVRSMFGGWGVYRDERMFALVAYETLYVKVDDASRADFETRGLKPFTYETGSGKRSVMAYHGVPPEALDSSEILCEWARKGVEAAARAAAKPGAKKRKRAAK